MNNINLTKQKLNDNQPVIGTFVTMNSPEIARVLSISGYDYLIMDYEHGAMGIETVGRQIQGMKPSNTTPIVRIPELSITHTKKALDAGAYGLMLPTVKCAEDVEKFVKYTAYPPNGIRGCGAGRANDFYLNADDYFKFEKTEILRIIQIETLEAIENLDSILDIQGIDVAFVGPYDLSFALGTPGEVTGELVNKTIEDIVKKCNGKNVTAGIMSNPSQLEYHMNLGFKFILLGLDSILLNTAAKQDIEYFNKLKK